jgi:hypothetical protein
MDFLNKVKDQVSEGSGQQAQKPAAGQQQQATNTNTEDYGDKGTPSSLVQY